VKDHVAFSRKEIGFKAGINISHSDSPYCCFGITKCALFGGLCHAKLQKLHLDPPIVISPGYEKGFILCHL